MEDTQGAGPFKCLMMSTSSSCANSSATILLIWKRTHLCGRVIPSDYRASSMLVCEGDPNGMMGSNRGGRKKKEKIEGGENGRKHEGGDSVAACSEWIASIL